MVIQKPGGGAGELKGITKKEIRPRPGGGVTAVRFATGRKGIIGSAFIVERRFPNPLQPTKELWRGIIRAKKQVRLDKSLIRERKPFPLRVTDSQFTPGAIERRQFRERKPFPLRRRKTKLKETKIAFRDIPTLFDLEFKPRRLKKRKKRKRRR